MKLPRLGHAARRIHRGRGVHAFQLQRGHGPGLLHVHLRAIHAQTGIQIGLRFAGAYCTKRESLQIMKGYCGKPSLSVSIQKLISECGFDRRPPFYAQRGDPVLVPNGPSRGFLWNSRPERERRARRGRVRCAPGAAFDSLQGLEDWMSALEVFTDVLLAIIIGFAVGLFLSGAHVKGR